MSPELHLSHRKQGRRVSAELVLFKGRKLTGFSNVEETQSMFAGNAPWLLEDRLRLAGALCEAEPAWSPHSVADGNLVTGQQNYSAQATADAVMEKLGS